ncbi:MAG: enoyl-CoA hydratase/isomerase family protein [Flavobacteriales bacterium]|nr:enoyl-CoA hydratase/isomerase family protein [Flavobacteriales bacterium]
MEAQGTLTVTIHQSVATITFGHPAANSFPSTLLEQLVKAIEKASNDSAVKIIVLKSEGDRVFCSGASFDELLQVNDAKGAQQFFAGFANVINAMRKSTKLIVGRVQGKVVGGGVGIVAACDYVIASAKASMKLSEVAIGIGPFVIAPAIERKAGKAALSHLSLSPTEWKSAEWAAQQGLFAKVVASNEELEKEVNDYAQQMAQFSAKALKEMKKMLWEGTEDWDELLAKRASVSGQLVLSEETRAALQQFKNK